MESDLSGFVLDHAKYCQLSLEDKRALVHEIVRVSKDASKILLSWSRQDLAELISAEVGSERKCSGRSKIALIERLLKLISEYSENSKDDLIACAKTTFGAKRQRKNDYPEQLATGHSDKFSRENYENKQVDTLICRNLACRATINRDSIFCKRCSCCICFQYDDNKDPSLWLTCDSESAVSDADSCGMSCHLRCALKDERSGIVKDGFYEKLDGSYYCVSCGKVNGLMRSWRKQLLVAKDARRVDVLCQRMSLAHKILKGTEQYKELHEIVENVVNKLSSEIGPIDYVPSEMARGLVSRLPCAAEIQQLCTSAIEAISSLLPEVCPPQTDSEVQPSCSNRFEEISPVSVVLVLEYGDKLLADFLGCRVWHSKSTAVNYPEKPTYIVLRPEKRFVISDLDPSTKYFFKVSVFSSTKELGAWESTCVTRAPAGVLYLSWDDKHEKEQTITGHDNSQKDSTNSSDEKLACSDNYSKVRSLEDISKNDECHLPPQSSNDVPSTGSMPLPPSTPSKSGGSQDIPSSTKNQTAESNYEYCVQVIRWLEREGHMQKDFRVKFLTWFSLKSTVRDRRVVSAFVDNLIDDPSSLADQLVDTFTDEIDNRKKPVPHFAFCTRLWH